MTSGLWAAQRRSLTIGLAATVTFVAAEALAVVTVMPLVARDLNGLNLYGAVFSAFLLGTMTGIVAAGRAADRHGPALPYVTGVVVFGAGLTIAGLAPSMPVLVVGRALQGLGAGAVPAVAYVAIGRSLPDNLRAKMMAVLSTAWVAPGLAGPSLSAAVARAFGWRWVFLGLLPFIVVAAPLALPALVRLGRPEAPVQDGHRLADGIGVAVAAGLLLAGLTLAVGGHGQLAGFAAGGGAHGAGAGGAGGGAAGVGGAGGGAAGGGGAGVGGAGGGGAGGGGAVAGGAGLGGAGAGWPGGWALLAGCAMILAGGTLGLPTLRRLLPAGTLRAAQGLPATVLSRALLTFMFFGADAFVTLAMTIVRHQSPAVAGIAVTGSTLAWTAGAWVQARLSSRWEGRRQVRIGLVIILAGTAGLVLMLSARVPVVAGIIAWTVAGLGMGLSYAPITLLVLKTAPTGREGWAAASLNLADVLGSALGIGLGGAAISAAASLGWPLPGGVAVAFALAIMAGAAALAISRRLPGGLTSSGPPSEPDASEPVDYGDRGPAIVGQRPDS